MSNDVGVGLIGCGGMGSHHARNLASIEGARLRGVSDVRLEVAEKLQKEVGAEYATAEPRKLLDDDAVDVVLICTHHDMHTPLCVEAAEAGKHIFVEKPLALTIAACEEVEAAVVRTGVKLMVGFQARFSPFIAKLKETVPEPLVIVGQLVDPRWGDESWANDPIKGGGNVLSQGCHLFDAMCWLAGAEPVVVHAEGGNFTHPKIPEITDSVVATIRYANGCVASAIVGDFGAPALAGKAFYEIFGGTRTATLYGYYSTPAMKFWGIQPTEFTMNDLPQEYRNSSAAHGYIDEMKALIDWVGKGVDPMNAAKVKDGVRATKLGVKAIESIKTGQPQRL